jgi:rhamnulokinase
MSAKRVAVDLGANSGRVALGWLTGGRLEFEIVHRFSNGAVETPEGLKWDFKHILLEVENGLKLAGERGDIASVGVDSWGVDYGIVDARGSVLCSPFHYRDARTNGLMEKARNERGAEIYSETGLQFLPFNTLYQLQAHVENDAVMFNGENRLLMVPDLVHLLLGGQLGIERTNASTTQFYNPRRRQWTSAILEDLPGIEAMLPPIIDAGADLGVLRDDLRANPGLSETQIVAPATHDTASAVLAVPMTSAATCAYVISGTWTLVGLELGEPLISDEALEMNFSNEVGAHSSIRFLKNVMGLWIFQECVRAWGIEDIEGLITRAADCIDEVGSFDPDDRVFLEPGLDMPNRVLAAFEGLSDDPVLISAAIFKSLAQKTAAVVSQAAELSGRQIDEINIVGGGSQNRLLNQLIANYAGVVVHSGPVEATLVGNLLSQFESAGELNCSIREVVKRSYSLETFEPSQ